MMKTLELQQGTAEWKAARKNHLTASEASIMMSCSSNVSRNKLLEMKATGTEQEFSDWFQKYVLDKGHEVEAMARPIAEKIIGEELYPIVGLDEDRNMLASFDGCTMLSNIIWECKQSNAKKIESIKQDEMPMEDYWQVAHQLVVSRAEQCLYMVTDGTEEGTYHRWVSLSTDDEDQLLAGWAQFEADLKDFAPREVKPVLMPAPQQELPTLSVDLVGEVRSSNLIEFKEAATARIQAVKTELVTDQDFVDADETIKLFTKTEKRLDVVKEQALAQTASIEELFKTLDEIKSQMRTKRLALNKLTKERKEQIRTQLILSAKKAVSEFMVEHEKQLEALAGFPINLPSADADFAGAIKGKKTVASLESAIDDALATAKISVTQMASKVADSIAMYQTEADEFDFLFSDKTTLVLLDASHLRAEVRSRIADYKEAERVRQEQVAQAQQAQQEQPVKAAAPQPEAAAVAKTQSTPRFEAVATLDAAHEHITIPMSEYEQLRQDSELLHALKAAGVDNWSGWTEALEAAAIAA
ncbi:MAG: YqaJ viral recombinase family protein [Pontibacterium sp.]